MTARLTLRVLAPPPKYSGWRCLHKAEGGNENTPLGMPEVTPPLAATALDMTQAVQEMSYKLMLHFNQAIQGPDWNPKKIWSNVHKYDIAFTNEEGFEKPGDPRRNYILNEDLTFDYPKYDKQGRLCGGAFIHGLAEIDHQGRDVLRCKPGIHGIDARGPMPEVETIAARNWYFFALNYFPDHVEHFAQGQGQPVAIPFIFDRDVVFERRFFEPWEGETPPDPLKIYHPL